LRGNAAVTFQPVKRQRSASFRRRAARWNARRGRRLRRKLIVASFIFIALLLLFAVIARDWSGATAASQAVQ